MKVQLSQSPLKLLSHEFLEIHLNANLEEEKGGGAISVERDVQSYENPERIWSVILEVKLQASEEGPPPTYTGGVTIAGMFEVVEGYQYDPERLIRVTAASMLYGTAREMIANLTARSANGMISLPSVSFIEKEPVNTERSDTSTSRAQSRATRHQKNKRPKKKVAKRTAKRAAKKAARKLKAKK